MYTPDPEEIRMRWLRRRGPKPKPGVKKGILRARVMILGDCGVGKSTLLKMLTGEKLPASDKSERKGRRFSPCEPTVGVELVSRSLMVKGNRIEMAIWDFSGDPVFKLVRDQLYRYCQLGILVFDVTKRESFVNLGKWIKEAEAGGAGGGRSGEKLTFVICGAKADLRDKRTVPKTEAQIWARTRGYRYFESPAPPSSSSSTSPSGNPDLYVDQIGVFSESCKILHEHVFLAKNRNGSGEQQQQQYRNSSSSSSSSSGTTTGNNASSRSSSSQSGRSPNTYASSNTSAEQQRTENSKSSGRADNDDGGDINGSSLPDVKNMRISEMKQLLVAHKVDPRTCITRTDLEKEVLKILKRLKIEGDAERKRQQKEREQKRRESIHKAVSAEIAQWSSGKSLRQLLNGIHGYRGETCPLTEAIMEKRKSTTGQSNGSVWRGVSERGDHYLGSQASANAILKAYKKALVLIHPDKFDLENYEAYAKATETFKAVNAAYVAFKNHT